MNEPVQIQAPTPPETAKTKAPVKVQAPTRDEVLKRRADFSGQLSTQCRTLSAGTNNPAQQACISIDSQTDPDGDKNAEIDQCSWSEGQCSAKTLDKSCTGTITHDDVFIELGANNSLDLPTIDSDRLEGTWIKGSEHPHVVVKLQSTYGGPS